MATLRDIKKRIKGVQNTQQITKAMKMVAAARLRRAQENIINARPYARKISEMLSHLVTEEDMQNNPFIVQREVKNVAIVVVTADQRIMRRIQYEYYQRNEENVLMRNITTGMSNLMFSVSVKKDLNFFQNVNIKSTGSKTGLFSHLAYRKLLQITNELIIQFLNGTFDKVIIVYNEFRSIIQQKIVKEQFLPIPIRNNPEEDRKNQPNYIYEPDQKEIFKYLLA